jgi:hypothetical protein
MEHGRRQGKKQTTLERMALLEKVVYKLALETQAIVRAIQLTEEDAVKKDDKDII